MPLYEYQCQSCAHRFERIQKFSDPPVAECPNCGGPVEKLISSPAIQFKGSGFYITDYAKSGSKPDAAGAAKPGAAAASGDGGSPKGGDSAAGGGTKADSGASAKPAAAAAGGTKAD
ncbi:MAG: zinc ribbon domain-containing protein [Acidobacteria bacterium]|nr:zinc ribbon domain-containing protein [Acidobacteriota bacterium]